MKVSVIIPTLNEENNIAALINSIFQNKADIEIIVVDDGSQDKTPEIASSLGVKVIKNNPKRQGPSKSRNNGAKIADGEVLCFFDADYILFDTLFFKKTLEKFENKNVAGVRTPFTTIQDTLLEKIVTKEKDVSFLPHLIRKKVFFEINGYPEIGFGEDQLYAEKIVDYCNKNNKEIVLASDAYFSGHGVHTLSELYKQGYWYGKTGLLYIEKLKQDKLKSLVFVYLRAIHFLSFFLGLFFFINQLFLIFLTPFFLITFYKFFSAIKYGNLYIALQPATYLVSGLAMLHGLFYYLVGIDKKIGL